MITITHFKHEDKQCVTVSSIPISRRKWRAFHRYAVAWMKPNYSLPAIPLAVKYDYRGCVNIDDVTDPDDPHIVYMYDSWTKENV